MKIDDFLDRVRRQLELPSEEAALSAAAAVLETLGERLERTERENLAAQLADPGYPQAVDASRAVIAVLQEAVTRGEIEDVISLLPAEYRELFGAKPQSPVSPTAA